LERFDMKVLVCGGRRYSDALTLGSWLGGIQRDHGITEIIQGGATGADFLACRFADFKNIPVRTFTAEWDRFGKAAGPIRNRRMLEEGNPDLVVAFPGGTGTADMVSRARAANIKVIEVKSRSLGVPVRG
jgi:hypothetical protein